ncbi:hypothetical protein [Falsiphaeobacter marinintestinus]|uniref:hypothetical protein n=1 Tax=Falsiphaeobacter marinintestinus TaxID=1492905 RepID=UPI0011B56BD1|nr:hypothetical protein [Phaeobacter marinintestinus]
MSTTDDWVEKLKQTRDEIKLQLHLGSKEAEDEWDELVGEWDKFAAKAQLEKSSEEVADAARDLGLKLKSAFDRMKKT